MDLSFNDIVCVWNVNEISNPVLEERKEYDRKRVEWMIKKDYQVLKWGGTT